MPPPLENRRLLLASKYLNMPLEEVLSSLLRTPVCRRPSAAAPAVDIYPLALPNGEGALDPIGRFGEIGFKNLDRILILTVPVGVSGWVQQRLGTAISEGPVQSKSSDGTAMVAHFTIRLVPGMKTSVPMEVLGEVGVEAG